MNKKGSIKKVFPGGNTARGFYSYYNHIVGLDAERLFIIKGGPGVGKSSFMKKVGNEMVERGYDVEFHQCSSDNNSLDGVVIPALKIAIIDGTAPHVVDPKHPGAIDEILNFGEFWNEEGIRAHRQEIMTTTMKISKLFKRAYRYFAAAKAIRDDMEVIYEEALDKGKFHLAVTKLKNELLAGIDDSQEEGNVRHLFGSAYSPNGLVDYYETIVEPMEKIIYIQGEYIQAASSVMENVMVEAVKKGLFVEVYHEPMIETNIETMLIPELKIAISTSRKYEKKHTKVFCLDECMKKEVLNGYTESLKEDKEITNQLLTKGLVNITNAKKEHDVLETYYVPNMNFKKINELREALIEKILTYGETIKK